MNAIFYGQHLNEWLGSRRQTVYNQIDQYDDDDMIDGLEDELVEYFCERGVVQCPAVNESDAHLVGRPKEAVVDDRFVPGRKVRAMTYRLAVPFTGDSKIFALTVGRGYVVEPARVTGDYVELTWTGTERNDAKIKKYFEERIGLITTTLGHAAEVVDRYNTDLREEVRRRVAARIKRLRDARETQEALGYPIRERSDSSTQAVPLRRHEIKPSKRKESTVRSHEYVMLDDDFEAAIGVLLNMRNAFERNPTTTARLAEQMMRDVLLIGLNARFEGQAAGEVFNGFGKTDIIIRVEDRNLFVGECKIYDPKYRQSVEKVINDALDQLLRYTVWRDSKAVLVLFIRAENASRVIEDAVETIEQHDNYVRRGKRDDEDRHEFVVRSRTDTDKELHLSLLPFVVA